MLDIVVLTLLLALLLFYSLCLYACGTESVMRCYLVIAKNRRFQRHAFRLHCLSKPFIIPHTIAAKPRPPLVLVPHNRCHWASVAHSSLLTWNGPQPKVGQALPSYPCSLFPGINPTTTHYVGALRRKGFRKAGELREALQKGKGDDHPILTASDLATRGTSPTTPPPSALPEYSLTYSLPH